MFATQCPQGQSPARLHSMALITEILGVPKRHKSGVGAQKLLNFSQVRKFQMFIKFLQFIANNGNQLSWWPCLRKKK